MNFHTSLWQDTFRAAEIFSTLGLFWFWKCRNKKVKPVLANQIEMREGKSYLVRTGDDKPAVLRYQGRAGEQFLFQVGSKDVLYARAEQIFGSLPVVFREEA